MKLAIAVSCLVTAVSALSSKPSAKKSPAKAASLNGWVPNGNEFAWGLPGSIAPFPQFDPIGASVGADLEKMKNYREAELQHGRVAM
jgi:hypothetical protein